MKDLDLTKDQHLIALGLMVNYYLGHVEIEDGKIVTNGTVGENTYENFVDLNIWTARIWDWSGRLLLLIVANELYMIC